MARLKDKVPCNQSRDLHSVSETHMVEGESQLYQVALWPSHESYGICRQSTQTVKKNILFNVYGL